MAAGDEPVSDQAECKEVHPCRNRGAMGIDLLGGHEEGGAENLTESAARRDVERQFGHTEVEYFD